MKKIKRVMLLFLSMSCIISSFLISTVAATSMGVLDVTRYEQEQTNWCWAASAQMIGKYVTVTTKFSQSAICKKVKGEVVNEGANNSETQEALEYTTVGRETNWRGSYFKFSTVQKHIDSYRPFVAKIKWDTGVEKYHVMVVDGYIEETYKYIHFVNPGIGSGIGTARYHYMVGEGTTYKSHLTGTWINTLYLVKQ